MPYVIAAPEMMTSAAADLAAIGSNVSAAHMAAAPTVAVIPAAADEVSASIAHLFSQHAAGYHAVAGQAAAFHEQFVQLLNGGAASYASAEAASTSRRVHVSMSCSPIGLISVQPWLVTETGADLKDPAAGLVLSLSKEQKAKQKRPPRIEAQSALLMR